jgi:hemerythrin
VLGELNRFAQKVTTGSILMGRAYVVEQLPSWFDLHAKTMDSALAAHLKAMHSPSGSGNF